MIVIIDSGSTKADWCIIKENQSIAQFSTAGLNPYFTNSEDIKKEVLHTFPPFHDRNGVKKILFFGAGCASNDKKAIINSAFLSLFPLSDIFIESDMFGAAKALFHNDEGIAVILGTGSNSCLWNGQSIIANSPSLGYILGDEGSGAHLGLTLSKRYLNNQLPQELKSLLEDSYPISRDILLENVYRKPFPNRFLAHYTYFLKENSTHPYIKFMVSECFLDFFDKHIKYFNNFNNYKIRFIGSIAFHFQEILEECSLASEIEIDSIIQSPIEKLVQIYSTVKNE